MRETKDDEMIKSDLHRLVEELPETAVNEAARRLEELLPGRAVDRAEVAAIQADLAEIVSDLQTNASKTLPGTRPDEKFEPYAWLREARGLIGPLGPGFDSARPHIAAGRGEEGTGDDHSRLS
jgi:hypothetical protein